MKLTTVSGKPARFKVTKAIEEQAQRYLQMQFKKRISEGKEEKDAAEMAALSLKYFVGEINDINFDGSDVAAFMKDEIDWIESRTKAA